MYIICAVSTLSLQFPILKSTHHLLPSPHGELAPAIHAVLDVFGTPVNVVVVHNGQGSLYDRCSFIVLISLGIYDRGDPIRSRTPKQSCGEDHV